ncbi:3-oxoacyl-ACP reductase FabG [Haloflavibacter putidus]|uniref:3-oxoacyl-ACP reductase FabG n=1 Tax=Haloflavibacter putidus TaxID=2576776 RepID=A0A507ZQW8_9FLAO|nr:3-oxoacyl-ACP reductase FabG [Haloflavibacter putidus]TQD39011.1 3-oxoacyl-ACP reductase FabG [Haloflavibacter putidus]
MATEKKYAVVSGGSRGIGRAIALQLAKDLNYNILLTYYSQEEAAKKVCKDIEDFGLQANALQIDVSQRDTTRKALNQWQTENSSAVIEVLVNNAGIRNDGLFVWQKDEAWDSVLATNLNGFYNLTQALLEPMLKAKFGRIINIVSLSGEKGNAGQVNYSAAKAGVIGATKALAQEIAKRKVTVNAVAPGFIKTDMTKNLNEKELKKSIPANRFGTPEEVANLVSFLASEKANYITGQVIHINGGIYS